MELTGTIIAVLPAVSGVSQRTGNTWMKQDYVIEVPGQYPRRCAFCIFGEDRIKQFAIQQGEQNVTIQFDIDAHEFNGKWYNEVRAYNVLRAGVASPSPQATSQATAAPAPAPQPGLFPEQNGQAPAPAAGQPQGDNPDDLPF